MPSSGAHLQNCAENCAERGHAFCRQKLSAKGRWSQLVKDLRIQLEDFPGSSGEKMWQSISNSISFALTIIAPNVVSRELLGQAKRARKTVRVLMEARVFRGRIGASVNVPPNRWPLEIFQTFEAF